jgi:methylenetetrahydrofolate dehydrogenase (NADP+)/methenyltetrahydrofolate cyclohydrolase
MSEARIIDGKAHAAALRSEVAERSARLASQQGVVPTLRVILVGDDPASRSYVTSKERMAREAGIDAEVLRLASTTSESGLLDHVRTLNDDPQVHAILVQLPLPEQIGAEAVIEAIDPAKDVDGFHPMNVGRLFGGGGRPDGRLLIPCTPLGCLRLLNAELEGDLAGRKALVLGRSNIVGKPMAALLLGANCTVTVAHSRTRDLPGECRNADILVAAVGRPNMVKGDWIRPGSVVIDVGINRVTDAEGRKRLTGDVAFEGAREVAGAITPVPGGVGPMTVACLLHNTLVAAEAQAGIAPPG